MCVRTQRSEIKSLKLVRLSMVLSQYTRSKPQTYATTEQYTMYFPSFHLKHSVATLHMFCTYLSRDKRVCITMFLTVKDSKKINNVWTLPVLTNQSRLNKVFEPTNKRTCYLSPILGIISKLMTT